MWSCLRVLALSALSALPLSASTLAEPAQQSSQPVVLFQNVRIFDGTSDALSSPSNVLVRGNQIETISADPIPIDGEANATTIDGGGRTLMPGLIDMHWHAMLVRPNPVQALASDAGYLNLLAGAEATATLMRGFTTIRDMGGPSFGLKRAIDKSLLPGPRIYPSGAMITITSGHGDFRQITDLPRTIGGLLSRVEQIGGSMIADSPDEVGSACASNSCRVHRKSSSRRAGESPHPSAPWMCRLSRSRSSAQRWKPRRIGAPLSAPTPTRQPQYNGPSLQV